MVTHGSTLRKASGLAPAVHTVIAGMSHVPATSPMARGGRVRCGTPIGWTLSSAPSGGLTHVDR
jgi:hypothetical protein